MSEEKPHFKVNDRRLFNSDGTPRDTGRDFEAESATAAAVSNDTPPAASPMTETTPPAATATTAASPSSATPPPSAATRRDEPSAPAQTANAATPAPAGEADEDIDPTPFANLVMFIASPAAAAMGMTEHPGLAPGEVDLPLAKHCIDLLATVQQKSRGNLGRQEQQLLEGLLAELRMQFVSLTSTRPAAAAPPRGFTGSDITGGR